MDNIYNFLKSVWIELKEENKVDPFFLPILLLLATIPMPLGINNVALGILVFIFFLNFKKLNFKFNLGLILLVLFYVLMTISIFWTIDVNRTLVAIPKEIALLILPLIFLYKPFFLESTAKKIIKYFSFSIVFYVFFYLCRAVFRYIITNDERVFFYHGEYDDDFGLVPKNLNAIHMSVYVVIAFFYFLKKRIKTKFELSLLLLLLVFVMLLSSKNIIIIFLLLIILFLFFFSKIKNKIILRAIIILVFITGFVFSFSKIKERFLIEFQTNIYKDVIQDESVRNVSVYDAWTKTKFEHSDYFPGTAFRVYQIRMFLEFLEEEPVFWKGFGLNASLNKLLEKEKKYNLYPGYGEFNFHNQYIQVFAELGLIGFLILLILLAISTKNAFKSKNFIHISFSILILSLFLTESFLWRQRGVVFFTLFYCLLNTFNLKKDDKIFT